MFKKSFTEPVFDVGRGGTGDNIGIGSRKVFMTVECSHVDFWWTLFATLPSHPTSRICTHSYHAFSPSKHSVSFSAQPRPSARQCSYQMYVKCLRDTLFLQIFCDIDSLPRGQAIDKVSGTGLLISNAQGMSVLNYHSILYSPVYALCTADLLLRDVTADKIPPFKPPTFDVEALSLHQATATMEVDACMSIRRIIIIVLLTHL